MKTKKNSTKQLIMLAAIELFAKKGYRETSVREIAAASNITEASMYNHFSSKNEILSNILDDYAKFGDANFVESEHMAKLQANPTPEGILSCMTIVFLQSEKRHLLELFVLLQEQHRNPVVNAFIRENVILSAEIRVRLILQTLIDLKHLSPDLDMDYWCKIHSSVVYAFANRTALGLGDYDPEYEGHTMRQLLCITYEIMFRLHGT
ncbi:MAG: TetR/AcrR family transcriptional regulator [Peptococcaceae bacterium]|jgi:AcrR family transcriptional regulator|nr:TetR/AcrR family transcriptional regulator [Peptococcaceae bacterium]